MKKTLLISFALFTTMLVTGQEKQKQDTLYYITGNKQEFGLLKKAILYPGAMTRNEIDFVAAWIDNKAMLPKKQEAETPKTEKPKN